MIREIKIVLPKSPWDKMKRDGMRQTDRQTDGRSRRQGERWGCGGREGNTEMLIPLLLCCEEPPVPLLVMNCSFNDGCKTHMHTQTDGVRDTHRCTSTPHRKCGSDRNTTGSQFNFYNWQGS